MSMQPQPWPQPAPEVVAAVRAMYARRRVPLAVQVRDRLGELFADAQFAQAFGVRGRPGWSPGRLALVTVLQMAEGLSDRQAAEAVRTRIDWKYALGLGLADPGFDASVLCEFRARVVAGGLEERALELLLAALKAKGLVGAGGRQRTDSTHVVAAVRELTRLELVGESVRACLEALAVAAPGWLARAIDVDGWAGRYGARVDDWRLPASRAGRAEQAVAFGRDAVALLGAVWAPGAPEWLRQLPAVEVLRVVVLQNYTRTVGADGEEVVGWREADTDGLPPCRLRLTSPYDLDARWGSKGAVGWTGYKVHLSETCQPAGVPAEPVAGPRPPGTPGQARELPNLITNVATTDATVPDQQMTTPIHRQLARRGLLPATHYLDGGYPSAELLVGSAATFGVRLITPLAADHSPQARAKAGFARADFHIDWDAQQVRCPQGHPSSSWNPCTQRGNPAIVVQFPGRLCRACPVRAQCTTSPRGRQLTLRPRQLHQALHDARAYQTTAAFQADYALRAGVEGTIGQAIAVTGIRRARYRGLAKVHLQHVYAAVALNLLRLDAWWNDRPLDRTRTSHLLRLHQAIAA